MHDELLIDNEIGLCRLIEVISFTHNRYAGILNALNL